MGTGEVSVAEVPALVAAVGEVVGLDVVVVAPALVLDPRAR